MYRTCTDVFENSPQPGGGISANNIGGKGGLKEENMKGNIKGKERKRGKIDIRWIEEQLAFHGRRTVAGGGGRKIWFSDD